MIGKNKHFISLNDYSLEEISQILEQAEKFKAGETASLIGKQVALLFTKSSTRTRVSFESAINQLGGSATYLSPESTQMGRGETLEDTIRVLERYVDSIVIRNDSQADLEELARFVRIPLINGLSDLAHPCQALADLFTIKEHKNLSKVKVVYLGDGNNVTISLAKACHLMSVELLVVTPPDYICPREAMDQLRDKVSFKTATSTEEIFKLISGYDVVYTDTWTSMGQEEEKATRLRAFQPFQINSGLAEHLADDYIFLHCLPAYRGQEVSEEVLDGSHSLVFDQAENRLHVQKAILYLLLKT